MKGKDLSKLSVIRHFCRVFNTALIALVLCFTFQTGAFAATCSSVTEGYYCKTRSTTMGNIGESTECPAGCYCPGGTNVSSVNSIDCSSHTGYAQAIGGGAFICPNGMPDSASQSKSLTNCYTSIALVRGEQLSVVSHSGGFTVAWETCSAGYYCSAQSAGAVRVYVPSMFVGSDNGSIAGSTVLYRQPCSENATSSSGAEYCTCKSGYSGGGGQSDRSGANCAAVSTYTIVFNANGGSGGQSQSVTATYGSAMPAITSIQPTRSGYQFKGWYDNANYKSGTQYYTATGASARTWNKSSNATLYAGWQQIYAVSLDQTGGSGGTSTLYALPDRGIYWDSNATDSAWDEYIVKPTKGSEYVFNGYYDTSATTGGNLMIDANGFMESGSTLDEAAAQATGPFTIYARWRGLNKSTDCPTYESTAEFDGTNYLVNTDADMYYIPNSSYQYFDLPPQYAQNNDPISRCQVFFSVNNNLIPHTATNISGYTHTMMRAAYSVANINSNGYTANANNYNRGAQIQFTGIDSRRSLHCEDGYANKQASSGMIFYNTLAEALAKACTLVEQDHYSDDGVVEQSCPTQYPHSAGGGNKTSCYATVTLVFNNGHANETLYKYYTANTSTGYTISSLPSPTKTGLVFQGWYRTSDFSDSPVDSETFFANGDATLYAKYGCDTGYTIVNDVCVANTYKVTLNNQGANSAGTPAFWYQYRTNNPCYYYTDVNLSTCMNGSPGTYITIPQKTGYEFGGYYTEPSGSGVKYVSDVGQVINNMYYDITTNTTLYAKWTPIISGAITLDSKYYPSSSDTSGTAVNTNATPTPVYSKYGVGIYTSVADANSGTNAITHLSQIPVRTAGTPSVFNGFYTDKAGTGTQVIDTGGNFLAAAKTAVSTDDTATWYAKYTACSCNAGDNVMDCTPSGQIISNACQFNVNCRTGWKRNGSASWTFTGPVGIASVTSNDCTEQNETMISFDSRKYASNSDTNPTNPNTNPNANLEINVIYGQGLEDSDDEPVGIPILTGYAFNGYWTTKATDGIQVVDANGYFDEDIDEMFPTQATVTVYAHWVPCPAGSYCPSNNFPTLCAHGSYSAAGAASCTPCSNGTTNNTSTPTAGGTSCSQPCINAAHVATWEPTSWYSSQNTVSNVCTIATCASGYERAGSSGGALASYMCVAQQQVVIDYVLNGGTGSAPSDVCTLGGTFTMPSTPTKPGYNFTGWTLVTCGLNNIDIDIDTPLDATHTRWKPESYPSGYTMYDNYGTENSSDLDSGEWALTFSYGTVKGNAKCSSTSGVYSQPGNPSNTSGQNCWCQANRYIPSGDNMCPVASPTWIYHHEFVQDACDEYCAYSCVRDIQNEANYREAIYGTD